jgi:trans-aconitate methyltransferase
LEFFILVDILDIFNYIYLKNHFFINVSKGDGEMEMLSRNQWDAKNYDEKLSFVTSYGTSLVTLLNPQKHEFIVDLGCGTGHLTYDLSQQCAKVAGIDYSEDMIEKAKEVYPELPFLQATGETFMLEERADAVFSNAALHWMKDAERVIANVNRNLKMGGRFVAEMGGEHNVGAIIDAIYKTLDFYQSERDSVYFPWFFPSLAMYTTLLEKQGFEVQVASYFHRPTPLDDCPNGVADWVENFAGDFLAPIAKEDRSDFLKQVNVFAKEKLFKEGKWVADYKRLRFIAIKRREIEA